MAVDWHVTVRESSSIGISQSRLSPLEHSICGQDRPISSSELQGCRGGCRKAGEKFVVDSISTTLTIAGILQRSTPLHDI